MCQIVVAVACAVSAAGGVCADLAPAWATLGGRDRAGLTSKIDWSRCGVRLQCARVRVPLDWSRPSGAKLSLPVVRHLASRPARRRGSLFVNAGGATGSTDFVMADGARLDALVQGRFDVVGWALRGTGGSRVVRCFADRRSRARFWGGVSIPTTSAQSLLYLPKT